MKIEFTLEEIVEIKNNYQFQQSKALSMQGLSSAKPIDECKANLFKMIGNALFEIVISELMQERKKFGWFRLYGIGKKVIEKIKEIRDLHIECKSK